MRPQAFRGLFEALFRQHLQSLRENFKNAPPVELWARLFLCSFLGQLSGLKDALSTTENLNVTICEHYFDFYQHSLPDVYAFVLGEFTTFPLLERKKYELAWTLERHCDHLARLLERDGPELLALAATLFNLH